MQAHQLNRRQFFLTATAPSAAVVDMARANRLDLVVVDGGWPWKETAQSWAGR